MTMEASMFLPLGNDQNFREVSSIPLSVAWNRSSTLSWEVAFGSLSHHHERENVDTHAVRNSLASSIGMRRLEPMEPLEPLEPGAD